MSEKLPLVSFCMVTYNHEKFILDALEGAASQTYENMEIIISDDCSTDRTFDIVSSFVAHYKGKHRFILNRNEKNLGIAGNFNKVLYEIAHGDILVIAAGDDVSQPERTKICVDFMLNHADVMSVSCSSEECDADLNPKENTFRHLMTQGHDTVVTLEDYVYFDNFILYPGDSRVLRREVIESFPPLAHVTAEDIYLFFRSIMMGSVGYIRQPLVKYRIYGGNVTQKKDVSVEVIKNKRSHAIVQFQEDLAAALKQGYVTERDILLIQAKIDYLVNWMYPIKKPQKQHSKLYKVTKRVVKKMVNIF